MSVTEQAVSRVEVDSTQAESALKELRDQAKALKKEYNELKFKNDPGATKKKRELAEINKQIDDARKGTFNLQQVMKNLNGSSLKELSKAQRQLTADIRNATRNTKEEVTALKEKQAQLRKVNTEIDKVRNTMTASKGGFLTQASTAANKYFTLLTGAIATITGVVFSIKSMIQRNAELSDSMADVAKSTGLTMGEVKELNRELRKIDTRTGRKELLDLAYVAGKLGYTAKTDVLGFVRAADQIGVALAKDLGGNVEDAVNSLGKIADLFKVKQDYGIEEALLKTGSAINALGAASSANEAYIVEFTKRLGGVAPMAGLTVEEVMGLGATLDQLGQQTEMSSTAISQLLTKMFKKPGEYAKIAGIDVKEFSKLLKTDANEALIMFLGGLQKNKGGLTELAAKFGDLGIDGSRAIGVIGALANNIDILRSTQALSNAEFRKGTSLTNEFNIKNENMAANLAKVGRGLLSIFVNSDIMNGMDRMIAGMANWFKIPMSQKIEEERVQVNILANKLMDANLKLDERKKIITELNGLAPDVVKGINAEAIAYGTLTSNLTRYNKEAMNRVIIQKYQEVIDEKSKDLLKITTERLAKEDVLRKQLLKLGESAATNISVKVGSQILAVTKSGDDLIVQAQKVKQILNDNQTTLNARVEGVLDMSHVMNQILVLEEKEGLITGKVNEKFAERDRLMKEFGITSEEAGQKLSEALGGASGEGGAPPNDDLANTTGTAIDALRNKIKKLDDQISNEVVKNGQSPLAWKLQQEKTAAELLLKSYEDLKKALEAGVDVKKLNRQLIPYLNAIQPKGFNTDTTTNKGLNAWVKKGLHVLGGKRSGKAMGPEYHNTQDEKSDQSTKDAWIGASFDIAVSMNDAIFKITADRQDREFEHQMNLLDKQREKELSNKKLTEAQKDAINAKYDEKQRKLKQEAFKKQKSADIIQSIINNALSVGRALAAPPGWPLNAPSVITAGVEGLLQTGIIAAQQVPEYGKGLYTVTGMSGKVYNDVSYTGPAVTGIYTRPALISESGKELIIDAPTTKNLQMNYPEIIAAIMAARVPQYASGRYSSVAVPAPVSGSSQSSTLMIDAMNRFADAVDKLDKNGIKGNWVYKDFTDFDTKVKETESRTGL
jgi:TP901 family phage tail tape measure protein